jgi:hypothetical protein
MTERRLQPPWIVSEHDESFVVLDASGPGLAYVYFEDEPGRRAVMKRLTRDEAHRIAANVVKLPRSAADVAAPTEGPRGEELFFHNRPCVRGTGFQTTQSASAYGCSIPEHSEGRLQWQHDMTAYRQTQ